MLHIRNICKKYAIIATKTYQKYFWFTLPTVTDFSYYQGLAAFDYDAGNFQMHSDFNYKYLWHQDSHAI